MSQRSRVLAVAHRSKLRNELEMNQINYNGESGAGRAEKESISSEGHGYFFKSSGESERVHE